MLHQFGMDYGLKPSISMLTDTSFQKNYSLAECMGLVYVNCPDSKGVEIPCEFGFMMKNKAYAEKFLDNLIFWQEQSAGDSNAVDLEFLEKNDGDYLLSISPNMDKFIERMIPDYLREHVNPTTLMMYQAKAGMRIGERYSHFRDSYLKGRKIAVRYFIVDSDNQIIERSEKYFVKTEFKFSKEGHLNEISMRNPLLNRNIKPQSPPIPKIDDKQLIEGRLKRLKYFFPISFHRFHHQNWLTTATSEINVRYTQTQIFQAICNLTFHERLKLHNPSELSHSTPGLSTELIRHLAIHHESVDSMYPNDEYYNKQTIEKQIRMDEKYFKDNCKR